MDPTLNSQTGERSCFPDERQYSHASAGTAEADRICCPSVNVPDSSLNRAEGDFVNLQSFESEIFSQDPCNLRLDSADLEIPSSGKRRMKKERPLSDKDFDLFDSTDHSEERIDSRETALLNRISRRQGVPKSVPPEKSSCDNDHLEDVPKPQKRALKDESANGRTGGNRRRQIDPTTCERDYSRDEVEFMRAMDNYKRTSGRMFPTCSEILEVIRKLGYVKVQNGPY